MRETVMVYVKAATVIVVAIGVLVIGIRLGVIPSENDPEHVRMIRR